MRSTILVLVFIIAMYYTSSAQPGYTAIIVEGTQQGKFRSEPPAGSKQKDQIEILGLTFEVNSPRDAASGAATGRRTYQPLAVWKRNGESSPQFIQALNQGEILKKVTVEYYRQNAQLGTVELFYTIVLENASVVGFRHLLGPLETERFNSSSNDTMFDEIRFSFQKITITNHKGNITTTDTWSNR